MTRTSRSVSLLIVLVGLGDFSPAQDRPIANKPAADTRELIHTFREVSISPDGRHVAWVGALPVDTAAKTAPEAMYVTDLATPSAPPRRITAGDGKAYPAEHGIAWSPDGQHIAFLSDAAKTGQQQIYVVAAAGGAARKLTGLRGAVSELHWSGDGKQIGYLFIENPPRAAGPIAAVPPETGVIGDKVFEQRLGMVDVASGQTRTLTAGDLYVYEYAWSPDAKTIAMIAAHGSGDNNWYIAQLYTLSIASGEMLSILKTSMQIAVPCWSPDGKNIAFIGGLMSDEGVIGSAVKSFRSRFRRRASEPDAPNQIITVLAYLAGVGAYFVHRACRRR